MAEITLTPLLLYTLLCVLVVAVLLKLKLGSSSSRHLRLPPGPWTLPVIGNMHHLLGAVPHQAMERLARRYGPVVLLRLGHFPTLVVSSPEAAREVMKTHDAVLANRPMHATADILTHGGQNIAFAAYDSKHWKELRKLCTTELLTAKRVLSFRPIREEEAEALVRSVAAASSSSPSGVNITERIKVMMNNVIMRASVGDRCPQREAFLEVLDKVLDIMSGFNLIDLFPTSRLARAIGGGSLRAATDLRDGIDSVVDAIMQDHESAAAAAAAAEAAGGGGRHEREDILDLLLRLRRDGLMGVLTDQVVSRTLFDVFAAGSETSSTTILWAMSELMRNPRVMERAQSEIRQVLHGKTEVKEEDFQGRLHYLQMVIKETFRLHPPVPLLLPRQCVGPCKIMGYDIPKGTTILVNFSAIGRDEKNWNDAEEFKPERFEDVIVDYSGTNFRFLPGGAGRRMCPGLIFGLRSIEMALASLLYHFDWKLPNGANPHELDMTVSHGITARRKNDLMLEATRFVSHGSTD